MSRSYDRAFGNAPSTVRELVADFGGVRPQGFPRSQAGKIDAKGLL